jgi:hypothetical protein
MDERTRRVGLNEAVFRELNEQVESLNRSLADLSDNQAHVVGECGDLACVEQFFVPEVRADPIRLGASSASPDTRCPMCKTR